MRVQRWVGRWGMVFLSHAGLPNCPGPGWTLGYPIDSPIDSGRLTYDEWRSWLVLEAQLRR